MPIEITAYVPNVKPGSYNAVCTGCTTRAAKDGSGDFRVWEFTLADGTGRTIGASSSLQTSPKSKAGKWIAAMLGRPPQVGENVEVVGLACIIGVELNDDGFERVTTVTAPLSSPVVHREPVGASVAADEAPAKPAKGTSAEPLPDELPF